MIESLFSQSWYRVEGLKPRLRSHVQIHRHTYRDEEWYVLQDHSSGRFHRFSPEAYLIIGLMDGRRSLGSIWETACARLGDDMPTQDEVIGLLAKLHQADVLQSDLPPDFTDLQDRFRKEQKNRWLSRIRSPMALRFPLFDPDALLNFLFPLFRPLLGWLGVVVWLAILLPAIVLAGMHWSELTSNLTDRVLSLENLALLWLVYPVVKTIHEFGHALLVKRWGGEVHEMGIMFLVFMPIPYVDASSSLAFREKRQRMIVAGGGILVEAFLAGVAMLLWVHLTSGAPRAVVFNVMLVAGVSTLLFNGNPLLRYDAYYVLADFLEIPNLGARANRYVGYLLQRFLLGIKGLHSPASSVAEAAWLGVYSLAAFGYRIFISVKIALFVAGKFFVVGVILALWSIAAMGVFPLIKIGKLVFSEPLLRQKRRRIGSIAALATALAGGFIFGIPMPSFTIAEGIVWAPEQSRVHAGANGFVARVIARPDAPVVKGEALLRCEDPELETQVRIMEAQLTEYTARHRLSVLNDRTEAEILEDEIARIEAELARARERREELSIRSPNDGIFLLPDAEDLPGRFVRQGLPLGYVVDFHRVKVRVVVPQSEVDRVRHGIRKVEARLAGDLSRTVTSLVVREVPAASRELPSLALSLEGGGKIALDPREKEQDQAFENLFQFEIQLPQMPLTRVGERVYVRFVHDPEPLALRWYRSLRRIFLHQFDV